MKTRIVSILLAVCLIVGLLPVSVLAVSPTSGSCGKNARWSYDSTTKTLTVSGSGDMADYHCDPVMGEYNRPPWDTYREEIEHVIINEGITSIGQQAFGSTWVEGNYPNLCSVSIAPTVTKIGAEAFAWAQKLESIELPNVTSIGYAAFTGTGIRSIYIPPTMEDGEGDVDSGLGWFINCTNLQSITVDPGNQTYRSVDGVLFSGDILLRYPAGKAGSSYTVPNGTARIALSAFEGNENITSVSVPASVSRIDAFAFNGCTKLKNITIAEGVTRVCSNAFCETALTSIELPASVRAFTSDWTRESSLDMLNRTFFFTGTRAPEFDTYCCNVGNGYKTTICYPENATGWDAVQQQDNVKYQVEAGVLEFKTGTPPAEPSEPTNELKLVSTSPANGATDVTEDDSLVLTFNQELSKNLNWTKGSIYIKHYDTDEAALKIDSAKFYALGGTVSGNTLTVPLAFSSFEAGKYYITVDAALIASSDGTMLFAGIQSNQTLSFEFQKESHLYGCDFTMGVDSLSFQNYTDFKISDELLHQLLKKLSPQEKYMALLNVLKLRKECDGQCFGMSLVMALMKDQYLHPSEYGAENVYAIGKNKISPIIAYCHLLQSSLKICAAKQIEDWLKYQSQEEFGREIVNKLFLGNAPIIINIKYTDIPAQHTVLAYALDKDSDSNNYIVKIADPNALIGAKRNPETGDMERIPQPATIMKIDKQTYKINDYLLSGTFSDNAFVITSVYSRDFIAMLASYLPQSSDSPVMQSSNFSVLTTSSSNLTIETENGKSAIISGAASSGTLDIIGPVYMSAGNTTGDATYYIEPADSYKITYPDAESHDTLLVFPEISGSGGSISSTAKTVEFHNNGYVAFSEATGTSSLTLLSNNSDSTLYMLGAQTGNSDASITAVGEQYKLHSSSNFTDTIVYGKNDWCTAEIDTLPVKNNIYIKEVNERNNRKLVLLNEDGSKVSSVSIPLYVCFFSNGGSFVDAVTNIPYNSKLQQPDAPTKAGYHFAGWYKDEALTQQWRFDHDVVTEDIELYAKWVKLGQTSGSNSTPSNASQQNSTTKDVFTDVSKTDYFYDAVLWAVENGITTGTSSRTFSPHAPCTRAQIVTFLWRAAGCPDAARTSSFADVPADSYYAKAVAWAVEHGITTGTGNGKFSPDAACTRAQAVTFLSRALGKTTGGKAAFSDVPADSYYSGAVAWAVENGITNGTGNGLFDPDGICTRAQIVTFLYRAYQK